MLGGADKSNGDLGTYITGADSRDAQERYSLNDLHQASGGEEKDKPANCLRSDKPIELIDEILKAQIRAFKPVDSRKGRYGGTYVCKELGCVP